MNQRYDEPALQDGARPQRSSQTQVFSCSHCPYAFFSQLFLDKHLKKSHNDLYCLMLRNDQIPSAACGQISTVVAAREGEEAPSDETRSYSHRRFAKILPRPEEVKKTHQVNRRVITPAAGQPTGSGSVAVTSRKPGSSAADEPTSHKHRQVAKEVLPRLEAKTTPPPPKLAVGKKAHVCQQCAKSFNRLSNLKRHEHINSGEKPFRCQQCEKSFSRLSHLKTHQLIHTGERPYRCDRCDKSFNQLVNLKTHQLIHTGEKPFQCTQCDKGFSQIGALKRHQRVHSGEKPFCCKQCEKSFNDLGDLKRHRRIHTGEKPFHCEQCGKSFNRPDALRDHQCLRAVSLPLCPPESTEAADVNVEWPYVGDTSGIECLMTQ